MPTNWQRGIGTLIGDRNLCENYRGITFLNTAYKIVSTNTKKAKCKDKKHSGRLSVRICAR